MYRIFDELTGIEYILIPTRSALGAASIVYIWKMYGEVEDAY